MNKPCYILTWVVLCFNCSFSLAEFERVYPLPGQGTDLVGTNEAVVTKESDTLIDISERYQLGYNIIRSANPEIDAWLPGEGSKVTLPYNTILPSLPRNGIVINMAEMRLYAYLKDKKSNELTVSVYPISVGRGEWSTPVTKTHITGRAENPAWYPPQTIRAEHAARGDMLPKVVPAGPNNPLGNHLLMLNIPSYFIHGTNKRFGIGMQVTHGCIRMYPEDVKQLFDTVPNKTEVTIINQPVKTGWKGKELYLEVHPPLELNGTVTPVDGTEINLQLVKATKDNPDTIIDWQKLEEVVGQARGIPEKVGYLPEEDLINSN